MVAKTLACEDSDIYGRVHMTSHTQLLTSSTSAVYTRRWNRSGRSACPSGYYVLTTCASTMKWIILVSGGAGGLLTLYSCPQMNLVCVFTMQFNLSVSCKPRFQEYTHKRTLLSEVLGFKYRYRPGSSNAVI